MCGFIASFSSKFCQSDLAQLGEQIEHRGPDETSIIHFNGKDGQFVLFHRLAIMDTTSEGMQPFKYDEGKSWLVANGEIYNWKKIRRTHLSHDSFHSGSDCEVIYPLYEKYKDDLQVFMDTLDGEFAFVLYDEKLDRIVAARDPIGIRPLFYGHSKEDGKIIFASEVKALQDICKSVSPFPPGHYYDNGKFRPYWQAAWQTPTEKKPLEEIGHEIKRLLTKGVVKRLEADRPIGFLLSGGLDSSLVCAIAAKALSKPIKTFAVGIEEGPIDTKYARIVADHIGSDHHEILFKKEDIFRVLKKIISHLETFDITTIRASVGMYLVCEYIKENTDVRVLLTGEVSDELFGYKYTDFAPSAQEFQLDSVKRMQELYMYDVLRADRCISSQSLEARVPFSDRDFIEYVLKINPEQKMNTYGIGKYLLREAFREGDYLPEEILMREKAAFSDAVGHSVVDYLKEYAEALYTQADLLKGQRNFADHCPPHTKEALMYRLMFEEYYPGQAQLIQGFWMPNKSWPGCNVDDPSARVLANYGASGK